MLFARYWRGHLWCIENTTCLIVSLSQPFWACTQAPQWSILMLWVQCGGEQWCLIYCMWLIYIVLVWSSEMFLLKHLCLVLDASPFQHNWIKQLNCKYSMPSGLIKTWQVFIWWLQWCCRNASKNVQDSRDFEDQGWGPLLHKVLHYSGWNLKAHQAANSTSSQCKW